jgi:hypothetical protein
MIVDTSASESGSVTTKLIAVEDLADVAVLAAGPVLDYFHTSISTVASIAQISSTWSGAPANRAAGGWCNR